MLNVVTAVGVQLLPGGCSLVGQVEYINPTTVFVFRQRTWWDHDSYCFSMIPVWHCVTVTTHDNCGCIAESAAAVTATDATQVDGSGSQPDPATGVFPATCYMFEDHIQKFVGSNVTMSDVQFTCSTYLHMFRCLSSVAMLIRRLHAGGTRAGLRGELGWRLSGSQSFSCQPIRKRSSVC